ncbi:hypothetical protein BC830DRAFT_1223870 [Chytriomyces sp. MP71]|nr:hypothetical protein BC830DRAFT_1223870 [Chytriomyces sp. MP71]
MLHKFVPDVPSRGSTPDRAFASVAFLSGGSQVAIASTVSDQALQLFLTSDLSSGSKPASALMTSRAPRSDNGLLVALDALGEHIAVGCDGAEALLFDAVLLGFEKSLVRFTTPVHAVSFRPGRSVPELAVAGEDAKIRIVNVRDITSAVDLTGHNDAIKSLAFSHDGDYLASVDTMGDLHVWDLRGSKPLSARVLRNAMPATGTDLKDMGRMSWHPNGKLLAIPGVSKDINLLDTKTWRTAYSLKGHAKPLTAVSFSHDGSMLACTDQSGKMYFWMANATEISPFKTIKNPSIVTDFRWHPSKNDLVMVTESYEVEYFQNIVSLAQPATRSFNEKTSKDTDMDLFADEKRASSTRNKSIEDQFEFDDDPDVGLDNFVEDDDGNGYAEEIVTRGDSHNYYKRQITATSRPKSSILGNSSLGLSGLGPQTDIQECFQPGATPFKGAKRYLAFNLLGTVYCVEQSSQAVIHISHHDKSHRDFSFQDHNRFTMAALSSRGAAFASDPNNTAHEFSSMSASASTASLIEYKAFENWNTTGFGTGNNGWSVQLTAGETAKCLCITSKGVVVATCARYLRFISLSGVQTHVRSLPGAVVALAGEGEFVAVVYHAGGTFHGDQQLAYMLLNVLKGVVTVHKDALPVSPGSTLQWLGFSDSGFLATYDSCGVLRIMTPFEDHAWIPAFDGRVARDGKQITYWPIGFTDSQLMCIICKGGDAYPAPPKSIISDIGLKIPLLTIDGSTHDEEESLIRSRILAINALGRCHASAESFSKERELKNKLFDTIDKQVIKQVMAACKAEKTWKALELAGTLTSVKAIDAAMKVAVAYKLSTLANKINQLKETFMKREEEMMKRQSRSFIQSFHINGTSQVVAPSAEPSNTKVEVSRMQAAVTGSSPPSSGLGLKSPYKGENDDEERSIRDFANEGTAITTANASVAESFKRIGKGLFGLSKMELKTKEEMSAPAKVKNPFAVGSLASAKPPAATINVNGSNGAGKGVASVGSFLQDLKDVKSKDVKAVREKEDLAKKRKQESITGFFSKKAKQDGSIDKSAPDSFQEEEPLTTSPNNDISESQAPLVDDEMDLDAELNKLRDTEDCLLNGKGTENEGVKEAVEKENVTSPPYTTEEKGKGKLVDPEVGVMN